MHELTTWILREEVKATEKNFHKTKNSWVIIEVSILYNGWKDTREKCLINFLVNCPERSIFIKYTDASNAIKNSKLMFKLIYEVVEKV